MSVRSESITVGILRPRLPQWPGFKKAHSVFYHEVFLCRCHLLITSNVFEVF